MTVKSDGSEKNRLEPLPNVVRQLWVFSGNECAWPSCEVRLVDPSGAWVGKIAHIVGAEQGSARHDPAWSKDELRDYSNLILLCGNHHDVIDHVNSRDQFTVETLRDLKERHESRYRFGLARMEEAFLNVTKSNMVRPCTTLQQFWLGDDEEEREGIVEAVNEIARYLATVTTAAREVLAFLVARYEPIDIWELARHNGEAEPVRTGRIITELENRKLVWVDDEPFEGDLPNRVHLWTGGLTGKSESNVLDGWDDFWEMLRDHLADRTDTTVDDVIVGLDFSLLD
ncbi:hypothetical protein ACFYNO_14360 [Kitasatospora sp. NPDC006697]|uniref:hypothetical protein n=1 Tax=unclassified Kitasatospora TaxID=2633591 RepID=UPI003679A906